jgi:hypothetical protein
MGVGGQCHAPAALHPVITRYPLYGRLGWNQSWSGWVRKISLPPRLDPWTVQPIASRYTDCAIPALYVDISHGGLRIGFLCVIVERKYVRY